jgi:PAS domain S-box-containing protein
MSGPRPTEQELLQRIEALERQLHEATQAQQRLEEAEHRLSKLAEAVRDGIAITERGVVREVNEPMARLFGYTTEEMIGMSPPDFHPPEWRDFVREKVLSDYQLPYEAACRRKDGSTFLAEICGRSTLFEGRPARVTAIRDITARRRAEDALRDAAVREEVIRAQAALLAELSAPILPVAPDVLVLPLIGRISAERAQQVIEALGDAVARRQARIAILDITGVPDVDADVGDALLRAARVAELLGAQVLLTGIRPEVARRLVEIGADLGGLATHGTLEQGIARALRRL